MIGYRLLHDDHYMIVNRLSHDDHHPWLFGVNAVSYNEQELEKGFRGGRGNDYGL